MRIGFQHQDQLALSCVDGLCSKTVIRSFVVVIPPGFGEEHFAAQVVNSLRKAETTLRIAIVAPDSCEDTDQFIEKVHEQWSATAPLKLSRRERYPTNRFAKLLDTTHDGEPPVLVIRRFPKMIEAKIAPEILNCLHTAEESQPPRVRTLNFSPLHYDDLRARWRRQGRIFCNSPYGYSHLRKEHLEPVPSDAAVEAMVAAEVPRHIAERLVAWTGAYPEPLELLVNTWRERGGILNLRELEQNLWPLAKKAMRRFLEWIGSEDDVEMCRFLAEVGHGVGADGWALPTLARHPWHKALIESDRLRADCLGPAALDFISSAPAERERNMTLARNLYSRRQFPAVERLLRDLPVASPSHALVLKANAELMSRLAGDNGEAFHIDADWTHLPNAITAAEAAYARAPLGAMDREKIHDLLSDLRGISQDVLKVLGDVRVVDRLCGLPRGIAPTNLRAAALLMLARIEIARAHPYHSAACDLLLHEPEQIFRSWAWVALGLNYYSAPELETEIWVEVERAFAAANIMNVTRPAIGKKFPSFETFARYAIAIQVRNLHTAQHAPENSMEGLNTSFAAMGIRRDSAHAESFASEKVRQKFFGVTDRWFDCFVAASLPNHSRSELLEALRPLPLVTETGMLDWNTNGTL